ncbi:MAG TPA: response regulator transcription factor [Chloroflexota bacterium]|jgi:two-component system, OmpR family, KDP operon response regulator KdpE|nr:response regulator transcription factor [Chloroflexota bacterium]
MSTPRVLVVDDEPQIRRALRLVLRANGYEVSEAATGEAALDALAVESFDLLILDLMLPDMDGVEVCRRVREWSPLPIVVLSAIGDEVVKVRALDLGADDYVSKPFSAPELLARMRSALRRANPENGTVEPVIHAGDVEIDLAHRLVARAGTEVHLTPTEYDLVRVMAQHVGRVITHRQLLRSAMGRGYEDATGTLRVHIASLRKKLEREPSHPRVILTEPGIGYRLHVD